MSYYLGVDIGSSFARAVVLQDVRLLSFSVLPSGRSYRDAADEVISSSLEKAGIALDDVSGTVATGYGGTLVAVPHRKFTDITCISRGIYHLFPSARTVIDIGGQYSRVIRLDESGRNTSFLLSDKCAGGSGKFLQTVAHVLSIPFDAIGPRSMESKHPVSFTTGCAVFAETEAISRVAEGAAVEDILAGVHTALAARIQTLVERLGLIEDVAVCGGGAKDTGLVAALNKVLGVNVLIPGEPHITTALGAALLAAETDGI